MIASSSSIPQGRVRWTLPEPGDLPPGETFRVPDDAFYTPDGRRIIVTHEDDFTITLVDVASRRIVWRYGKPGVHGSEPDRLWNPDSRLAILAWRWIDELGGFDRARLLRFYRAHVDQGPEDIP